MALPQTEEELQSLLDVMKQKNASSPEMKVVIDDFFDRKKLEGATPKAPEPPSLGEAVLGPAGVGLDVGKRTVEAAKGGVETLKSIKDKPVASGERFRKLISGGSDVFFAPLTGLMGEGIERAGLEEEASKLMEGVQTKATEVIDDFLVKRGLDPSSPQSIEAKKQLGLVPDLLLDAVGLGAAGKVAKAASKIDNIKLIDDAVAAVDELGEIKKSFSAKRADKAIQKEVTTRLKELQQIEDANGPVRKVIRQAEEKGIDVKQILTETDLLRGSVGPDGIMRTAQKGGAIDQLNDFIKPYENVISRILKQEGVTIDIDDIEAALLAKIEASDLKGANKLSARAKVQKELDGLSLDADEAGLITLLDVHKGKTDKYSTINYANPDTAKIDKLIARTYKELVEQNTKSIDVKNVNKELQTYFTVQDVLEKLDGRRLKGGKLGGYAADIVGAGVGAALAGAAGPLGVAAGAIGGREAARLIRGNIMKSKFSKATGKMPEASDVLKGATESATDVTLDTLKAPSGVKRSKIGASLTKGQSSKLQKQVFENVAAQYASKLSPDDAMSGVTPYERVMSDLWEEMALAEPGQRIFTEEGVTGISSTFPEWIPESLRQKALLDKVFAYLDPVNPSYPPSQNSAQRAFVDAVYDELDTRIGVDTSSLRSQLTQI